MVHRWAGSQCEVCSGNQGLADRECIECMPCTATAPDRRVGVEALHRVVRGIAQLRQQLAPDLQSDAITSSFVSGKCLQAWLQQGWWPGWGHSVRI